MSLFIKFNNASCAMAFQFKKICDKKKEFAFDFFFEKKRSVKIYNNTSNCYITNTVFHFVALRNTAEFATLSNLKLKAKFPNKCCHIVKFVKMNN